MSLCLLRAVQHLALPAARMHPARRDPSARADHKSVPSLGGAPQDFHCNPPQTAGEKVRRPEIFSHFPSIRASDGILTAPK